MAPLARPAKPVFAALRAWVFLAGVLGWPAASAWAAETSGSGTSPPRVSEVRFQGPDGPDRAKLASIASELTNSLFSMEKVVSVVRRLEAVSGVGGLALDRETGPSGDDLVFRFDGRARRLAGLNFVWDDAPFDEARSWEFSRRIEAATDGFTLVTGEPYHPLLRDLDLETVRQYFLDRGFRDARVDFREAGDTPAAGSGAAVGTHGLVDLTIEIAQGRRYVADRVGVAGGTFTPAERDSSVSSLRTQPDEPLARTDLEADRLRIALAQCRLGHPAATVTILEGPPVDDLEGDRRLPVDFVILPGPKVRTDRVQVVGRYVPWALISTLPLQEGSPFCPRIVEESRERIQAFLRDRGFPDPVVSVNLRRRMHRDQTRSTSVTFAIESLGDVRIERIWLRGNRVTREDVVRQHFAITEGELYRQSAVDVSIQSLRRGGLFKSVSARIIPGSRPGQIHLIFDLEEQGPIGVNVGRQQLILRNVDVAAWPGDYEQFEQGRAFRGGGQVVDVFAQPDRKGVEFTHEYLHPYLVAELNFNRRLDGNSAFDESWYTLGFGLGPKALEGRLVLIPFGELEWTRSEQAGGEDVPVLDGDAVTFAGGLKLRLDLNRRDEDRIPYLGFDGDIRGSAGTAIAGEAFKFTDYRAQLRFHLPLWFNARRQHFVLRLRAHVSQVFADERGKLQAHQRFFPQVRGYGSRDLAVSFPLADNQTLKLGGLHAAEAGAEIRVPMPWGRRNAFSPFVDGATVGDETEALARDPRIAVGLAYAFSLFSERVEGVVWGAYAMHRDASPTYAGASLGGNF